MDLWWTRNSWPWRYWVFVGFLRFDESADLKLKDIALHGTHFELFQFKAVKLIIIAMSKLSPLSSLAHIVAPGLI